MISAHRYFNISWYSFAISLNYCLILEHYLCITFVTYSKSVVRSEFLILSMIMCSSELYVNGTCLCCIFIPLPPNTPHQKVTQVTGQQMQVIDSNIFVDVHWDDLFFYFFFFIKHAGMAKMKTLLLFGLLVIVFYKAQMLCENWLTFWYIKNLLSMKWIHALCMFTNFQR